MTWQTFWMEPTGLCRLALRRYSHARVDPTTHDGFAYHNAKLWLPDIVEEERDERGYRSLGATEEKHKPSNDDSRWPDKCSRCEYHFLDEDRHQLWSSDLWKRTDNGEFRVKDFEHPDDIPMAEVGASWDSFWLKDVLGGRNPDGIVFTVRCPPEKIAWNDWIVDHEASTGGYWTRTGDPRQCNVTASPSIAIGTPGTPGYYHGFLQNGILTDPLPS